MKCSTDIFDAPYPHSEAGMSDADKAFYVLIADVKRLEGDAEEEAPPDVVLPVVIEATAVCSTLCDTFPVKNTTEEFLTDDSYAELLALGRDLLEHKEYLRIRDKYCRLSISLNRAGKLAPAFRPVIKSGAAWGDSKIHNQVHRDQVVIDLHWCHATKIALSPTDPSHQALFDDPAVFPFKLAYAVAGKNLTSKYRAAQALCLTTLQQCQLLKLRDGALVGRQALLNKGWRESGGKKVSKIAAATRQIGQWAERDRRIVHRCDYYGKLWLARELLEPGARPAQIGALHALMMGSEELDRKTIAEQLLKLNQHVKLD